MKFDCVDVAGADSGLTLEVLMGAVLMR